MKVLIVTNKNPFAAKDGGSLAILNVLEGYHSLGYDITLLMMNPLKHYSPISYYSEIILKLNLKIIDFSIDTNIKSLKLFSNLFFSKLPYNLERFFNKEFQRILINLLKTEKFDFVQFEGSYLGLYIDKIRKLLPSTLIILRAHNVEYEIWERNTENQKSNLKKIYFNLLAKRLKNWETSSFCKYDGIIPITSRDEEHIKLFTPITPFFTLPFTLDIEQYNFDKINIDKISLAYLGALDWIPNQEGLLWFLENIWKGIEDKIKGVDFYIAGRNSPEWLEKKIKSYRVKYLGEIDDAKQFIKEHLIFIVPLLSGSGMRIKIIEQMALGRVILATPIAAEGIDLINSQNGFICENEDDFLRVINQIIENPNIILDISSSARETIQNMYNTKNRFKELGEFVDGIVKK